MKLRSARLVVRVMLAIAASTAAAAQPSVSSPGKRLYMVCRACHDLSPGGAKIGPHLEQVVGRKAASIPGFRYSPALADSGIVWTDVALDRWLERPQRLVPGTTMAFAGMKDPAARAALIDYLRRLPPSPSAKR